MVTRWILVFSTEQCHRRHHYHQLAFMHSSPHTRAGVDAILNRVYFPVSIWSILTKHAKNGPNFEYRPRHHRCKHQLTTSTAAREVASEQRKRPPETHCQFGPRDEGKTKKTRGFRKSQCWSEAKARSPTTRILLRDVFQLAHAVGSIWQ